MTSQQSPTPQSNGVDETDELPGESPNTPAQVDAVAALLRGEEPSTDVDEPSERSEAERPKKGALKTLDDAAERLGVKVADLYALEFPTAGDGKSRKLGELKDLLARQDTLAIAELKATETQRKREADFMRAQGELDELIAQLPKEALKPEVVNAARKRRETMIERERARALEAIPEWSDDEKKAADVTGMTEFLGSYGFPRNFLMSVVDHRSIKLIRDFWHLTQRVDKALAAVKEVAPKPAHRPSGKASATTPQKSAPAPAPTSRAAQAAAVAQLIGATNANGSIPRQR